jgi:hypothetical protein
MGEGGGRKSTIVAVDGADGEGVGGGDGGGIDWKRWW